MKRDEQAKVEGTAEYTKNPVRGSVVNVNATAYEARKRKVKKESTDSKRLDSLESDVKEIKSLLQKLLEK